MSCSLSIPAVVTRHLLSLQQTRSISLYNGHKSCSHTIRHEQSLRLSSHHEAASSIVAVAKRDRQSVTHHDLACSCRCEWRRRSRALQVVSYSQQLCIDVVEGRIVSCKHAISVCSSWLITASPRASLVGLSFRKYQGFSGSGIFGAVGDWMRACFVQTAGRVAVNEHALAFGRRWLRRVRAISERGEQQQQMTTTTASGRRPSECERSQTALSLACPSVKRSAGRG